MQAKSWEKLFKQAKALCLKTCHDLYKRSVLIKQIAADKEFQDDMGSIGAIGDKLGELTVDIIGYTRTDLMRMLDIAPTPERWIAGEIKQILSDAIDDFNARSNQGSGYHAGRGRPSVSYKDMYTAVINKSDDEKREEIAKRKAAEQRAKEAEERAAEAARTLEQHKPAIQAALAGQSELEQLRAEVKRLKPFEAECIALRKENKELRDKLAAALRSKKLAVAASSPATNGHASPTTNGRHHNTRRMNGRAGSGRATAKK